MASLPSASALDRAFRCQASAVLPQLDSEPGASARRGTVAHAIIAAELRGWAKPDVGRYRIAMDIEEARAWLGSGRLLCELAMAYDPQSRRTWLLGEDIGREYERVPGVLYGTLDAVAIAGGAGRLSDWKSGRKYVEAADSMQLKTQAVMVAAAFRLRSVTAALAYLDRDGGWYFDVVEWGPDDLEDFADQLAEFASRTTKAIELNELGWTPTATPSIDTCRFCGAACLEKVGA